MEYIIHNQNEYLDTLKLVAFHEAEIDRKIKLQIWKLYIAQTGLNFAFFTFGRSVQHISFCFVKANSKGQFRFASSIRLSVCFLAVDLFFGQACFEEVKSQA